MMAHIKTAEEAIRVFYHESDPLRSQAHMWLLQLQQQPVSWEIASALLESQNIESQHFGATTLEQKIKKEWLCVAASAIAMFTVPDLWSNFIEEALSLSSKGIQASLQLLTVIPEEVVGADYVTQDRRNTVAGVFIRTGGGAVLQFLCSILQQRIQPNDLSAVETHKLALTGLQSWIQFDLPQSDVVFGHILNCLLEMLIAQPAMLIEIVAVVEVVFACNGKYLLTHPSVFNSMFSRLYDPAVFSLFHNSVTISLEYDSAHAVCQLFTRIGEHYLKLVLAHENLLLFLDILVRCAASPDREVSKLTLVVWCEVVALAEDGIDTKLVHNNFIQLVDIFRGQCMYDDEEGESDMEEYRQEVGDTILMMYPLLGNREISLLAAGLQNDGAWAGKEAALFLLAAVAEAFETDSENRSGDGVASSVLWSTFALASTLPLTPIPLGRSLFKFFAAYSRWLITNENGRAGGDLLRYVVQGLIGPLSTPGHPLAGAAATALCTIMEVKACVQVLVPDFQSIVNSTLPALHLVPQKDQLAVVEGYARLIFALPADTILSPLVQISTPFLTSFHQAVNITGSTPSDDDILQPLALLSVILKVVDIDFPPISSQAAFSQSSPPSQLHPLVSLLQAVQPMMEVTLRRFLSPNIVEAMAHLYKHALLSIRTHYHPILRNTLSLLCTCLVATRHASVLQVVSVAVSIFGSWQVFEEDFQQIIHGVLQHSLLSQSPPDTIKDFFSMCHQYIKYCPLAVVPYLEGIMTATMNTITSVSERHATNAALTLLSTLAALADVSCDSSTSTPPLIIAATNLFKTHGYSLTQLLFQGIGGALSRTQLGSVAEMIHSMVMHIPSLFRQWAKQLLQVPNFPSVHLTSEQKEKFLNDVMRTKGREAFKAIVQDFSVSARALREFGAATNPL